MNPTEMPPLWTGHLDRAGLEQLLVDLTTQAEILAVLVKAAPGERCGPTQPTFTDASEQLLVGTIRGLQVRYRHEGQVWCDTLLRQGDAYRVVRMREV